MRKSPEELDKVFSKLKDDEVLPSEIEYEKLFATLDLEKAKKSKKETNFLVKIAASLSLLLMATIMLFKTATDSEKQIAASKTLDTKPTTSKPVQERLAHDDLPIEKTERMPAKADKKQIKEGDAFETREQRKEIELADGSTIILNRNSKLRTAANFGKENRTVYLNGEAFFNVQKNANLPFVVYTTMSKTRVVGTSFNIKEISNATEEISVVSGKVNYKLTKGGDSLLLIAGNKCMIESSSLKKLESFDANLLAWKDDRIVFEKTTISDVINDLEIYFGVKINVANPDIYNCRYTGSFNKPTLEDVLDIISFSNDLKYQKNGDLYTLSGKGCRD